jgi:hypothetical protein
MALPTSAVEEGVLEVPLCPNCYEHPPGFGPAEELHEASVKALVRAVLRRNGIMID